MTTPNEGAPIQGQETEIVPGTEPQVQPQENTTPWSNYLLDLPESVRPLVEPKFKEWDADVTKRFQSLHSEYDPYKAYIDEYEPDAIGQALQVMQAIETNPQEVYQWLSQNLGLPEQGTTGQQQSLEDPSSVDDDPYAERFNKFEDMLGQLAQVIIGQQEQTQKQQQQQELDSTLEGLKGKHGEFDEVYVLTLMGQGMDPEQAVTQWKSTLESYASKMNAPAANAPTVVSQSGGGYPQNPVTPEALNDRSTRVGLVAQMLAAAQQQGA